MLSISLNDSFTEINNKLRNAIAEVDPSIISINSGGANDKDKQVTEVEVTAEDTTKLFDEVVSTNTKPTTRNPFLTALKVGKTHIDINDKFLKFGFHQILPKLYFHTTDETVLVINYGMGTGKTIAALNIINKIYNDNNTVSLIQAESKITDVIYRPLYIIGEWQTKNAFITDMLRPEVGYTNTFYNKMYFDTSVNKNTDANFKRQTNAVLRYIQKNVKFMTYQGLFNTVFSESDIIQDVDYIEAAIKKRKLSIANIVLKRLEHSVIVVDEIQRMYSQSGRLNTYGLALSELVKRAKEFDIRLIYLTGTLFNGNPREFESLTRIVDPSAAEEVMSESFSYKNEVALSKLIKETYGNLIIPYFKVESFDIPINYIESENKSGLSEELIANIPDFKLYVVERENYGTTQEDENSSASEFNDDDTIERPTQRTTNTSTSKLPPQTTFKIDFTKPENTDPNSIEQVSQLLSKCCRIVVDKLKDNQKCVIYSDELQTYGLHTLINVFDQSGFVRYGEKFSKHSICKYCNEPYQVCDCGEFKPIYYTVITGDIPIESRADIVNAYNASTNVYGDEISVVLLSSVGQAGVSFLHTNNILIINNSHSIPKLQQTVYRVIRNKSHQMLPEHRRFVNIYVMTTPYGVNVYKNKLQLYNDVKHIEKLIHKSSIFYEVMSSDLITKPTLERTPEIIKKEEELVACLDKITKDFDGKKGNLVIDSDIEREFVYLLDKLNYDDQKIYSVEEFIKNVRQSDVSSYNLGTHHDGALLMYLRYSSSVNFYSISALPIHKEKIKELFKINNMVVPFIDRNSILCFKRSQTSQAHSRYIKLNTQSLLNGEY